MAWNRSALDGVLTPGASNRVIMVGLVEFLCITRGSRNGRPIVRNAILALSDKWLSFDTRPMDEQIIIAQMSFINIGQVHIWFRTSADAMLLVRRTSASQISRQPLITVSYQQNQDKINPWSDESPKVYAVSGNFTENMQEISILDVTFKIANSRSQLHLPGGH